ncbi:hypothetical protein AbraIFM66951_002258 [Aspergillus brasiliensis]|uniref:Protein kinase domain-containing protein n=1 Tax=Aspergillus brasiliensis TaxID=319629 RepID=A0A9W5YZD1_9EURO|nr:hypothetical protein AbraCBS73388_002394 [Aspergillus brasiliensis]GKZ49687.1 hypothetical protein AbraIFM66951_002258 [Aspergillus brasiliensis]
MPQPRYILHQEEPVDEEICPGYDSMRFYPARPGEVLDNRYQILVKVGWGTSSTTWFARDMRGSCEDPETVVVLKITNTLSESDNSEREIEQCIANADPSQRGRALFRTSSDSFEINSTHGRHLCLAYEAMREPLWLFQRRFKNASIPLPLVKGYVRFLLIGLDYLHTACNVVHTDLKLDNIMMTFEDPMVMSDFMDAHLEDAMDGKIDTTGRPVYRSHNDFGPLRKLRSIPKIVDFGLATKFDTDDACGIYPIQPDHYRAPEVILGCGWTSSADIWNLGVLLWDLIEGEELFRQVYDAQGGYTPSAHLAEMIALLGPPPLELVSRAQSMSGYKWPEEMRRTDGTICGSALEYFGGPFFDDNGKFLHEELIPDRQLSDSIPALEEGEKEKFLSFVSGMLLWMPEVRKTAAELAEHPFLKLK